METRKREARGTHSLVGYRPPLTLRVPLYRALNQGWSKSKEVKNYTFIIVYEMNGNRPIVSLVYSEPELKEKVSRTEALAILDILHKELEALPEVLYVPKLSSSILMQGGA